MIDYQDQFDQLLKKYPSPLRDYLQSIPQNGGKLDADQCADVMEMHGISPESLMVKLLPFAKLYAKVPISNFTVGALAKARLSDGSGEFALFMGANIEFVGQALTQTIHAEQAAIVNAWLQGAAQIEAIAVSAFPCGRCRQFLYELEGSHELALIAQKSDSDEFKVAPLSDLLPQAFGPQDLAVKDGLMTSAKHLAKLSLKMPSDDPLVVEALSAARRSYAPYTHNFAGCAIQMSDGKIYAGPYVENAAFNPSLSPLHTAIIRINMDNFFPCSTISRAVLVEKPTAISQHKTVELLIGSWAPGIDLEYFEAD